MKRADIAVGHAAIEMSFGSLSRDEEALLDGGGINPFSLDRAENVESLLYFHLDVARRLRLQLSDQARTDDSLRHFTERRRNQAIADARRHIERLRELRHPIDAYLNRMILAEGLTP